MKKFRLVSLAMVVLMVFGMFAGCTPKPAAPVSTPAPAPVAEPAKAPAKLLIGVAMHTLSNPYQVQLKEGAEMFLKSLPEGSAELQVMVCEGNDEKEISNIKSLVARGGKDTILFIDPNQAPNAAVVADICEEAGVYWTSCWSTAEGVYPGQYPHYAMFQSPDDSKSGYDIAIQLFNSFKTPGKGKILAIQGELANSAAINRFKGLQKALVENPGIELLDDQSGAWNPQKALTITESWLSKYKDIDGIWVANDGMALAVIQALKAKGLNGKVKVVGIDAIDDALTAIKDGDLVATVASNGWLQAGYGLAYAYAAYTGKIDPKTMGPEKNMIHTEGKLLTNANLADYENEFIKNKPVYDYNDLEGIILRPMNLPEDYKK
jgi:ribose transport system substrate-binding protein